MELVLDELKQYVIEKITKLKSDENFNLVKGKKYIAVKYNLNREIINIVYAGQFNYFDKGSNYYNKHYNFSRIDDGRGYYFYGANNNNLPPESIIFYGPNISDYCFNEFYEIEESFSANRMEQVFDIIKCHDNSIEIIITKDKIKINSLKIKS